MGDFDCVCLDFTTWRGYVYKRRISYTHDTQTRNNNLWCDPQRVAPCGNQTHCPLYGSQLKKL
ncbi:hypothetical protein SFRURICE_020889 [Spodoptera frugiperda]|nr:hypothetical protein SFRURICE_020889 [Spodoptera frugiperda]